MLSLQLEWMTIITLFVCFDYYCMIQHSNTTLSQGETHDNKMKKSIRIYISSITLVIIFKINEDKQHSFTSQNLFQ